MQIDKTKSSNTITYLPEQISSFMQVRIQVQEQYVQNLMRLNNQLPHIQNNKSVCGTILKSLKALHSQKIHQVTNYANQLKSERQSFKDIYMNNIRDLQTSNQELIAHQKNLKNIIDKIHKHARKLQEDIRASDEKFLIGELTALSGKGKTSNNKQTNNILKQQQTLKQQYSVQMQKLKQESTKLTKKIKKHEKAVKQQEQKIQFQILDFVKRFLVQQVSLIRNIQYDIDSLIKRTGLFEEKQNSQTPTTNKKSKNPLIKLIKQTFSSNQLKDADPYYHLKQSIIKNQFKGSTIFAVEYNCVAEQQDQHKKNNHTHGQQILNQLLQHNKNNQQLTKLLQQSKGQKAIGPLLSYFQHFRNQNKSKIPLPIFQNLQKIFKYLLRQCYLALDCQTINKLIVYAHVYQLEDSKKSGLRKNRSVLDCVSVSGEGLKFMGDIHFWKFLLYFAIRDAIVEVDKTFEQKQMHSNNTVFSVLVANSLNMIICQIDKYPLRNTLMKYAKGLALFENQIQDLLKFIDHNFDQYKKQ